MHPLWEKLAQHFHSLPKNDITVATLDVWDNHITKVRFDVKDMPWILLFKNDEFFFFPQTGLSITKSDAGLPVLIEFAQSE
jgi:hypothetical protein